MKNESLKMIVTLLVICVLIAGGMSVVNGITAPIIAQNDVEKLNNSLALVLDADTFTETASAPIFKKQSTVPSPPSATASTSTLHSGKYSGMMLFAILHI